MAERFQDVIVLLPGILGSELAKERRVVWGWSGGVLMRNLLTAGHRLLADLSVAGDSPEPATLEDGIRPTRLLPDLHLIPGLWKVDGYGAIQQYLRKTFSVQEGLNFFPFPYDWRRDNRAAAIRLRDEGQRWLAAWRETSGNNTARLILIGHSMGGLVARYFLEVLEGWRDTRALITFGTPHCGSMNALDCIGNGLHKCGIDLTSVARGLNSLHQLLPTYACCQAGDDRLRRLEEVKVPGLEPNRLADAHAFHEQIRVAAQRNLDNDEYRRSHYLLFPIIGYNQPTYHSAKLRNGGLELLETLGDKRPGGDGTVPRQSAVPLGTSVTTGMFASSRHASLQNSAAALTHVGGIISSLYLSDDLRGAIPELPVQVSLDLQDVYSLPEPVTIRARPSRDSTELIISFLDHSTGRLIKRGEMCMGQDGWHHFTFQAAQPGVVSVVVGGGQGVVEQARDVIEIVAPQAVWT